MNNKERYLIDRCMKVSMDLLIVDTENQELIPKTINFTELSGISIQSVNDHIVIHVDDIVNDRSFSIEGATISFEKSLVTANDTLDMDED